MFGFRIVKISGHSLEPAFTADSFGLVRMGEKNLRTGDAVVLKISGELTLKRIQKITPQGYYIIGDNQADSSDSRDYGLISADNIIGKIVWH